MPQIPVTVTVSGGRIIVPNNTNVPWQNVGGIRWQLNGGTWGTNGIEFGSDWTNAGLPQPTLQNGDYVVNYTNNQQRFLGTFKYTVTVSGLTPLDPDVTNDPPPGEDDKDKDKDKDKDRDR